MHRTFLVILALAVFPGMAAAEIVPTDDPGSDCVAATITTSKTPKNRAYDERYCAVNASQSAYDTCLRNLSSNTVVSFFTDRCNAPEEGAFVSFNGRTHRVFRAAGKRHRDVRYAGKYRGEGLVVQVIPRKRMGSSADASMLSGSATGSEAGVRHAVEVIIQYAGETLRVPGQYDDSP
jgi:hypothetical protein